MSPSDDPPKNPEVIFDSTCSLRDHVANVCRSINFNLYSIGKIRKYLDRPTVEKLVNATITSRLDYCNSLMFGIPKELITQLKFLERTMSNACYKSFISANFNYCPIVWLFCGKTNLKKLEKLQERALATVYCDKSLAYEDMLKRSGQLCIRLNLIRLLAIEMFKCMNGLNPLYINDMFSSKDSSYNLRDNSRLMQPKFNTKRYGYKSFKYLGSKVWNCLPPYVKNVNDLNLFKKNIYNWCLTGPAKNLLEQLEV